MVSHKFILNTNKMFHIFYAIICEAEVDCSVSEFKSLSGQKI